MPDSMGKRKRRDVTARKHAAREERRVARAGRKKDREAGIIEPGPPIGPAEQSEFLVLEPEVDGEDAPRRRPPSRRPPRAEDRRRAEARSEVGGVRTRRARPRLSQAEVRSGITPVRRSGKRRGPDAVRRVLMSFGSN